MLPQLPCTNSIHREMAALPSVSSQFVSRFFQPQLKISLNSNSRVSTKPLVLRISSDYTSFEVRDVSYRSPGTQHNLLNEVNFSLPEKSFGLIFGRSGSGKTTLLQLLAGLSKPTSGSVYIQSYGNDGRPTQPPEILSAERVGIVFQFPERYFLADTVLEEVTFGWPRQTAGPLLKEQLALGLQSAIHSVGLHGISLDQDPHSLSGGFKRRLALAIQLVQKPDLLLLDEPLAGLGNCRLWWIGHGGWKWGVF
ncbi:ABC transporter I family member 11, chloroplastic isoform X2 [Magnolia sinica]|uniref:ABC transporter I family member 11, chloroplastic isoform X2 n=1 Tax=Magnolia sinica TaxID=86752 RepID=UPI0026588AD7|nr:ABC transporter I family member 11, chloroplastic isoform X2 [Magnolia sinica]